MRTDIIIMCLSYISIYIMIYYYYYIFVMTTRMMTIILHGTREAKLLVIILKDY